MKINFYKIKMAMLRCVFPLDKAIHARSTFLKAAFVLLAAGSQISVKGQITNAAPYCQYNAGMTVSGLSGAISKVTLGTLNNVTAFGNLPTAYTSSNCQQLYTYYNNVVAPSLTAGSTTNSIALEFKSSYDGEPRWYAAYIDFNHNNIFDTTDEMIIDMAHANIVGYLPMANNTVITTTRSNTFTVPANAFVGTTRMRVIRSHKDYIWRDSVSRVNACNGFGSGITNNTWMFGEVEDYNVTIVANTPTTPTLVSLTSTAVTTTAATLLGVVNANGVIATASFEYGTTTTYGSMVAATPASITSSSNTPITANVAGLAPNTLYHYRIKIASGSNNYYSVDSTFKTKTATAVEGAVAGFQLMVYPNPSNGIVHINMPDSWKETTVRVFNTVGAIVFSDKVLRDGVQTINLENLPSGLYDLQIGHQDQTHRSTINIVH